MQPWPGSLRRVGVRRAAVALSFNAVLVSFDTDFHAIASLSALRLNRLARR